MKHRKLQLVMTLLTAALVLHSAMSSTAACDEPQAADVKAKPEKETTTPDNISVGGKTLSQWRAIFGTGPKKSDGGTLFYKPAYGPDATADEIKSTQLNPYKPINPYGTTPAPAQKPIPSATGASQRISYPCLVKPVLRGPISPTLQLSESEGRQTVERIIRDAQKAYWTRLAIIANNLANADTVAYKRNRTLLEGIENLADMKGNAWSTQGQIATAGIASPGGGPVLKIQTDFRQGRLKKTGHLLDIAIDGKGFFQVVNSRTGETIYTRAGNLSVNSNGDLTVGRYEASVGYDGLLIEPSITVPQDATSVFINPMGVVSVKQPGGTTMSEIGQILLASFINPQGLQRLGGKFFGETDFSGSVIQGNPGQESFGVIRQGHLECSNVNPSRELADWNAAAKRIKTLRQALPE